VAADQGCQAAITGHRTLIIVGSLSGITGRPQSRLTF
jgi:hypothetical protein